jgi:hypothetical protein
MTARTLAESTLRTQALDHLFSLLGEAQADSRLAAPPVSVAGPEGAEATVDFQPPPGLESPADPQAAFAWLQRERHRLEMYTGGQLARLQREHQAMMQQAHFTEQALVFRSQELSRTEELLNEQSRALQKQAAELAEREQKLAPYLNQLRDAQAEWAELRRLSAALRQDTIGQRQLLDALRAEGARAGLETQMADLRRRQEEASRAEAALAQRAVELQQRLLALERAEDAVQRRAAELEEFEDQLRQEFEAQERQLAAERGEVLDMAARARALDVIRVYLETQAADLRRREEEVTRAEAALAQRAAELQQRSPALDKTQGAAPRRAAELEKVKEQQCQDFEERERQLAARRREIQSLAARARARAAESTPPSRA